MNAAAWDEIATERRKWLDSRGLNAAFFREGGVALSEAEREALGTVRGRRVLHLQCATGEDTLSLANLGAVATGIDISPAQIEEARAKAAAAGVRVTFEAGDVQALPNRHRYGDFDIVYTGLGALVWLDDLDGWARGISEALAPGGRFVLYEEHPLNYVFEEIDGRLVVVHSYFARKPEYSDGWAHFPAEAGAATKKAEFQWTLARLVTTLGRHALATVQLEELPRLERWDWDRFPALVDVDRGKVPEGLLLVAMKL